MTPSTIMRLIRFDKPVGTLLLWYPTAWALWLANNHQPPLILICLLFLGTFFMRSAGCVFNDIADRHIDKHVKRTAHRPITCGEVTLPRAFLLLLLLLAAACSILLLLPPACFKYALLALLITGGYPFAKRFFPAPQTILGLAFSMGIPIAYAASHQPLDINSGLLWLLNFFWIIAYDTAYAVNDREDDQRIGVQSTARLWGKHVSQAIALCSGLSHSTWLILAALNHWSWWFYCLWGLAGAVLIYQNTYLKPEQQFPSHALYGLILWVALVR
jgi:4-hydroxybenzoate polyprenyltransferase